MVGTAMIETAPTTLLSDILPLLAADPQISDLIAALRRRQIAQTGPVPSAARSALAATLVAALKEPALLVAATPDGALRLHGDLGCWLPGASVFLFPPTDALPYEHMSPDI